MELEKDPHAVLARYHEGLAFLELSDDKSAAQDFQTVLNQKEDFADAHIGLGEAEEALGQEVSYRRAHAIDPHSIRWALCKLESYYPLADKIDRPAKDNYRTNVEGLMGYPRRELMAPIPCGNSWEELNSYSEGQCPEAAPGRTIWRYYGVYWNLDDCGVSSLFDDCFG
jgi:hypothetical protein